MYGNLTTIVGPMYGGKTSEILKRVLWAKNGLGKNVRVFKPAMDNRYSENEIVSHDGLTIAAESITVIPTEISSEMVVFDEIQFFEASVVDFIKLNLQYGNDVIVAGLDMDSNGNAFELSAILMAMADEVIKKTANCTICGRNATKTYRKTDSSNIIELGGNDKYEARCNQHWSS